MQVKLFLEGSIGELENKINDFLENKINVIDIKYQTASQIYLPFSAMIMYEKN